MGLVELNGILFDRTENVLELLSEAGRPLIQSRKWQGLFPKAGGNPPVVDGVESQRRFVAGALATLFLSEAKCFQRVLDCPVGNFHAKRCSIYTQANLAWFRSMTNGAMRLAYTRDTLSSGNINRPACRDCRPRPSEIYVAKICSTPSTNASADPH